METLSLNKPITEIYKEIDRLVEDVHYGLIGLNLDIKDLDKKLDEQERLIKEFNELLEEI